MFLGGFWVYVRGNIFPLDYFEDDVFEEGSSFFDPGEDDESEVELESTSEKGLSHPLITRTFYGVAVLLPCIFVFYHIGKFFGGGK